MDVSDIEKERILDEKIYAIMRLLAVIYPPGCEDVIIFPEGVIKKKSKYKLTLRSIVVKIYKLIDKVAKMKKILLFTFFTMTLVGCYNFPYDKEDESGILSNEEFMQIFADIRKDLNALEIIFNGSDTSSSVTLDLTLPTVGEHGTTIEWQSLNTSVLSDEGIVTRQVGDVNVGMVGIVWKHGLCHTKIFELTILSL